jgi:hypothetical protein
MRTIEDRCKELMEDVHIGSVKIRNLRKTEEYQYSPPSWKLARGMSRTALKRKIVTLRQMLMDLHNELD